MGFDFDMAQALAAHMGVGLSYQNHDFNSIIPALQSGGFHVVTSAIVRYAPAREACRLYRLLVVPARGSLLQRGTRRTFTAWAIYVGVRSIAKGSSQEGLLKAQSDKSVDVHLGAIKVLSFATDEEAFEQIVSGKSVAHISDFPVVAGIARSMRAESGSMSSAGSSAWCLTESLLFQKEPNRCVMPFKRAAEDGCRRQLRSYSSEMGPGARGTALSSKFGGDAFPALA